MPASTISRPTIVDGVSILNTQMLSSFIFDKIDQLFAGGRNYTQFEFGGTISAVGNLTQTVPAGGALGSASKPWGTLFLSSLSKIDWANNLRIVHNVDTWAPQLGQFYDFQGGRVKIANTLSVGNVDPTSSGAGVHFPAAQSASTDSNTLDDYEEGTFTPSVTGTWASTPTSVSGYYTKVGRCVHVTLQWVGGTKASTFNGAFGNLPFTASSSNQDAIVGFCGTVVDTNATAHGTLGIYGTQAFTTGNSFTGTTIGSVFYYV